MCHPHRDTFNQLEEVTGNKLKRKTHLYFAHHSLIEDVKKSKFTGLCRQWSWLGELVQKTADSEDDPYNMWVHQRTPRGVDKFGFRYEAVLPNGEISGLFYTDGQIWYQNWITVWYSENGDFSTTFPSGPGKSAGNTGEWKRLSTPLTQQQKDEYSKCIFF